MLDTIEFDSADINYEQWEQGGEMVKAFALVKKAQVYLIIFDDETKKEAMKTLKGFVKNSNLAFTWTDAAFSSKMIRQNVTRKDNPEVQIDEHDSQYGLIMVSSLNARKIIRALLEQFTAGSI